MSNKKTVTQTGQQGGSQSSSGSSSSTGAYSNTGSVSGKNIFDWQQMPDTPDILALRNINETVDPQLDYTYSRKKADLKSSFNNPLGGKTSAGIRDATLRSGLGNLESDYGQSRRVAFNDMQNRAAARKTNLAGLTAPRLVQSGSEETSSASGQSSSSGQSNNTGSFTGTSSGTQVSNGGKMADFLQSAFAGAGAAAIGLKKPF